MISQKIGRDGIPSLKKITLGNKYENDDEIIRFILPEEFKTYNKYVIAINKNRCDKKTIVLPVNNDELIVSTSLSYTPGTWFMYLMAREDELDLYQENVDISIKGNERVFISDGFVGIVRDSEINKDDVENAPLDTNLKIIYDELVSLKNEIEMKLQNGEFNGKDGFSPIAKVEQQKDGVSISITDENGTTNAKVLNGTNGVDGVSPIVQVTEIENGHKISITDKDGLKEFDVLNGKDGQSGGGSIDETILEKLAIKDTATGNPCVITDSADWKMKDLKVYGESYQDGTPSVENPLPIINKEVNQVKVTGKNLLDVDYLKDPNNWCNERTSYHSLKLELQPNNKYVISVSQNNMYKDYEAEYNGKHALGVATKKNSIPDLFLGNNSTSSVKNELVIMPNENVMYINIYTQEQVLSKERLAIVFDELLPNIQLEISNAKTDYEPYKEQLIPLTQPKPLTKFDRLEKRDGVWNWVYKHNVVDDLSTLVKDNHDIYGIDNKYIMIGLKDTFLNYNQSKVLAEVGISKNSKTFDNKLYRPRVYEKDLSITVNQEDSVADIKEHLHYKVIYEVLTETLVPLSDEEQNALNELTMYYPNTVIHTGTQTEVTYIADPKLYIDKKLQSLNTVQSKLLEIESKV